MHSLLYKTLLGTFLLLAEFTLLHISYTLRILRMRSFLEEHWNFDPICSLFSSTFLSSRVKDNAMLKGNQSSRRRTVLFQYLNSHNTTHRIIVNAPHNFKPPSSAVAPFRSPNRSPIKSTKILTQITKNEACVLLLIRARLQLVLAIPSLPLPLLQRRCLSIPTPPFPLALPRPFIQFCSVSLSQRACISTRDYHCFELFTIAT